MPLCQTRLLVLYINWLAVCEVSEWQPWTACPTAPSCRQDHSAPRTTTFHLPPAVWDAGREKMKSIKLVQVSIVQRNLATSTSVNSQY